MQGYVINRKNKMGDKYLKYKMLYLITHFKKLVSLYFSILNTEEVAMYNVLYSIFNVQKLCKK